MDLVYLSNITNSYVDSVHVGWDWNRRRSADWSDTNGEKNSDAFLCHPVAFLIMKAMVTAGYQREI